MLFLKPGITTLNNMLVKEIASKLIISLEAVFVNGNISYVYTRSSGI